MARRPFRKTTTPPDFYVDMKVDLHGMRPGAALDKVDRHLRRCHSAGVLVVHVVHGRGTGALRAAVRDLLSRHPLVRRFSDGIYGLGGDGVTIVDLVPPV
ncbi:MAG: Smr/MutS family protein [Chloroflexi bacterium]|nr:Smr/MutS family protein [Chloroflexota bacterium]